MKKLIKKLLNKETVSYLVFGVMTTVVNLGVFKLFDLIFTRVTQVDLTLLTNFIAWVFAVVFAYVTNKLFVFESKSWSAKTLAKEVPAFVGARIFSLGIEELGLLIFITWLGFDSFVLDVFGLFALGGKMIVKIALAVIVVVMNYIFSKFLIFKNKNKE